eukprot:TRINITY_DN28849_c0_g1_i2.p1 TRINITY_DN28849_c0_g1~~TRINITY_DN28849_c0_g1_i2.p1  ORF type:complete len:600 (+),score=122.09 TRINITY_DN28849_c0_g1_i2:41-1801(+)
MSETAMSDEPTVDLVPTFSTAATDAAAAVDLGPSPVRSPQGVGRSRDDDYLAAADTSEVSAQGARRLCDSPAPQLDSSPTPATVSTADPGVGPTLVLRTGPVLPVGTAVRLNAAGEMRFAQRASEAGGLLTPGEEGVVVRVGRQQGDGTAMVKNQRGETHLYWQAEIELFADRQDSEASAARRASAATEQLRDPGPRDCPARAGSSRGVSEQASDRHIPGGAGPAHSSAAAWPQDVAVAAPAPPRRRLAGGHNTVSAMAGRRRDVTAGLRLQSPGSAWDVSATGLRDAMMFDAACDKSEDLTRLLADLRGGWHDDSVQSGGSSPPRTAGRASVPRAAGRSSVVPPSPLRSMPRQWDGLPPELRAQLRDVADQSAPGEQGRPRPQQVPLSGTHVFRGSVFDAAAAALGAACAERARLRCRRALHTLRSEDVRQRTDLSAIRPARRRSCSRPPPREHVSAAAAGTVPARSHTPPPPGTSEAVTAAVRDAQVRRFLKARFNFIDQERNMERLRAKENRRMTGLLQSIARKNSVADGVAEYRERWTRMCRRAADAEAVRRGQLREAEYYARCVSSTSGAEQTLVRIARGR